MGFWAGILLTAPNTWELFAFFICCAALTAFHSSVADLYLLTHRCEDRPAVSVPKRFQSGCGGERPGQEQPQRPPVMLSQSPLLGLRPKLPHLQQRPGALSCRSAFTYSRACCFPRTVNSPIYTFSVWLPFLITSFSLGEEKAEAF